MKGAKGILSAHGQPAVHSIAKMVSSPVSLQAGRQWTAAAVFAKAGLLQAGLHLRCDSYQGIAATCCTFKL